MSISKALKLIGADLANIRRKAEQTHNESLLYFIDMAIAEAIAEARVTSRRRTAR